MAAEHTARLGRRIKEHREKLGLTQNALAEAIPGKADGTQVSKWERGKNRPSDDTLEHIANALKCDVSALFAPDPSEHESPDLMGALTAPASNASLEQRLTALQETAGMILAELERLSLEADAQRARKPTAGAPKGTKRPSRKDQAA